MAFAKLFKSAINRTFVSVGVLWENVSDAQLCQFTMRATEDFFSQPLEEQKWLQAAITQKTTRKKEFMCTSFLKRSKNQGEKYTKLLMHCAKTWWNKLKLVQFSTKFPKQANSSRNCTKHNSSARQQQQIPLYKTRLGLFWGWWRNLSDNADCSPGYKIIWWNFMHTQFQSASSLRGMMMEKL